MTIKKVFKENIKIKDLAYLNELGAEIVEFYPKNDQLEGKLYVTGNYHSSKNDMDKLISQDIPFTIVFDNSDFLIDDIDCTLFEYNLIEGQGVEITYEISVEYVSHDDDRNVNKEDFVEEIHEEAIEDIKDEPLVEEIQEQIKEEITNEIDLKLASKIEVSEDNLPQDKEILRNINEKKATIKIVYYQNEKDLDRIASNNQCSIDTIFKSNLKNDINQFKRVIIKNGK